MRCPYCYQDNDKVGDTRTSVDGFVVRRRRVCCACEKKFTTYERIESPRISVIKRDGSRVPFNRDSLQQGIASACWKRQISDEQIAALIAQVERDIDSAFETEVESRFIGERVMYYLYELDQVAYVRFVSVYRHFKNADDFIHELLNMKENPDMPSHPSDYLPKRKATQFPKTKRNRSRKQEPELPLDEG